MDYVRIWEIKPEIQSFISSRNIKVGIKQFENQKLYIHIILEKADSQKRVSLDWQEFLSIPFDIHLLEARKDSEEEEKQVCTNTSAEPSQSPSPAPPTSENDRAFFNSIVECQGKNNRWLRFGYKRFVDSGREYIFIKSYKYLREIWQKPYQVNLTLPEFCCLRDIYCEIVQFGESLLYPLFASLPAEESRQLPSPSPPSSEPATAPPPFKKARKQNNNSSNCN